MTKPVRVRIAPSPTGYIHVGNTHTAYINHVFAKQNKGEFVLRLDDTDLERHVEDAEDKIYALWGWLGLDWNEGPDKGGRYAPYRQSERLDRYLSVAEQLVKQDLAYVQDGAIFFRILPGDPVIFEDLIRGQVEFRRHDLKDFVIIKSNRYPTYQFATAVDEIDFEITHVIRGEDHLSNTPLQILVIIALGQDSPVYAHLPLLRNPDRSKLSKRQGHASLSWYKENGILPQALKNYFALLGWTHPEQKEIFSEKEFIELFSFDQVNTTAPVFDLEKLTWMNGIYLRELSVDELTRQLVSYYQEYQPDVYTRLVLDLDFTTRVVELAQERLKTLREFYHDNRYFFEDRGQDLDAVRSQVQEFIQDQGVQTEFIRSVIERLENQVKVWKAEQIEGHLREIQQQQSLKPKQAFMSLRLIVTRQSATPPLFDTIELLGQDKVIQRLKNFLL